MDCESSISVGLNYLMFFDPYEELRAKRVYLKSFNPSAFAFKNPCSKSLSHSWSFIPPSARSGIALAVSFGKPHLSHPLFSHGLQSVSSSYTFMQDKWAWETSADALCSSVAPYAFKYSYLNAKWAWESPADALLESTVDKPSSRKMKESLRLSVSKSDATAITSRSSPQVGTVSEPATGSQLTSCKTSPAIALPTEACKLVIPTIIVTPPAEEENQPSACAESSHPSMTVQATAESAAICVEEINKPKLAIPTIIVTPPAEEENQPSACAESSHPSMTVQATAESAAICVEEINKPKLVIPTIIVTPPAEEESQPSASVESSEPCKAVQATAEPAATCVEETNKSKLVVPTIIVTPPAEEEIQPATIESSRPKFVIPTIVITPPTDEVAVSEQATIESEVSELTSIKSVDEMPKPRELESAAPKKLSGCQKRKKRAAKSKAVVSMEELCEPQKKSSKLILPMARRGSGKSPKPLRAGKKTADRKIANKATSESQPSTSVESSQPCKAVQATAEPAAICVEETNKPKLVIPTIIVTPPAEEESEPATIESSKPCKAVQATTEPAATCVGETNKPKLVVPVTPPAEEEIQSATVESSKPKFVIPTIVITPPTDEVAVSEQATIESEVSELTSVKSVDEMPKPRELESATPKKLSGCQKRKKRAAKAMAVVSMEELCEPQKKSSKLIVPVARRGSGKSPKPLKAGKKTADRKIANKATSESQPSTSVESSQPCKAVQATAEPAAICVEETNKPKLVIPTIIVTPPAEEESEPATIESSEPCKAVQATTEPAATCVGETNKPKLVVPVTPPAEEEIQPATIESSRPKFVISTIVITPPTDEVAVSEQATIESEVSELTSVKSVDEMPKPREPESAAPKKLSGCQKRKKRAAKSKAVVSIEELCEPQKKSSKLILPMARRGSGKSPKPLKAGKKTADRKIANKATSESQPSTSVESSQPCKAVQATAEPAAICVEEINKPKLVIPTIIVTPPAEEESEPATVESSKPCKAIQATAEPAAICVEANKPKLVVPTIIVTPPEDNVTESKPATSTKQAKAIVESTASSTGSKHQAPESEIATTVAPPSNEDSSDNEPASAARIEIPAIIITPPCDEPTVRSSTLDKATEATIEPAVTEDALKIVVPPSMVTPSESKMVTENKSVSVESKNTATEMSQPESSVELTAVKCELNSIEEVESESALVENKVSELESVTPKKLSGCQKRKKRVAKAKAVVSLEELCEPQKKPSKLILPVARRGSGKSSKPLRAGKKGQSSKM